MGRIGSVSDTLNHSPYYHREKFLRGFSRLGYRVNVPVKSNPEPGDVLVIWNRSRVNLVHADRYESAGAAVVVAENGYIGKDSDGHILFAIALGHHCGAGIWTEGPDDRWSRLGIEVADWRADGTDIVVLPQRGIGEPGIAMPIGWTEDVVERLRKVTDRPVRVRPHPGMAKTDPYEDLRGAWAAVTWASGAGIKSIVAGVPVFHEMPTWIGGPAARRGIDDIEAPFVGDRLPMLRRLAWAQWTLAEIEEGTPFKWLLG